MRISRPVLSSVGVLLIGLSLWSFWYEPASFRVVEQPVALAGWPANCEELRIVVLADLHVGSPFKGLPELAEVVNASNAQQPDLTLLVGDYVIQGVLGGSFVSPEDAAVELAKLRAPGGVYAVLGNHDWWLDAGRVERALDSQGITVLEDRNTSVTVGDCELSLAGISDFWEGPHDINAALEGVVAGQPVVAFTHNPDLFPELPPSVDLLVAGHTHGGQVNLPFIGRPVVPSKFGARYARGHITEGGKDLFVSSGVGTSILPVRFRVPPEIAVVVLRAE